MLWIYPSLDGFFRQSCRAWGNCARSSIFGTRDSAFAQDLGADGIEPGVTCSAWLRAKDNLPRPSRRPKAILRKVVKPRRRIHRSGCGALCHHSLFEPLAERTRISLAYRREREGLHTLEVAANKNWQSVARVSIPKSLRNSASLAFQSCLGRSQHRGRRSHFRKDRRCRSTKSIVNRLFFPKPILRGFAGILTERFSGGKTFSTYTLPATNRENRRPHPEGSLATAAAAYRGIYEIKQVIRFLMD